MHELKERIEELRNRQVLLEGYLDLPHKLKQLQEMEAKAGAEAFWGLPPEERATVLKTQRHLSRLIGDWNALRGDLDEAETGANLLAEGEDAELLAEVQGLSAKLERRLGALEMQNLLGGENDPRDAIVMVHSGAGGTESADWAGMLFRMYQRWAERHEFKTTIVDYQPGEEAGIKSVTMEVAGEYAYGYLKAEMGVHRLVRISPFDANKRRHTSFASVFVYPDIEETIVVEIKESDLHIDTYRSTGAGGQHVNTTDSAVRITHLPTGIVVQCQNERSQHKNKNTAMKILRARLYEKQREELEAEFDKKHAGKQKIAWGSQIRSYVLHPYQLVKDHRTEYEIGNTQRVLDGDIDDLIEKALLAKVV
ncbi:MAG: peptide chain release factor 2 [Candidatus Lambdaproteobacteria bacterium]|nr:peptide chain release factor 2 [Candidatus Lambdaproteobacteria bacterium]